MEAEKLILVTIDMHGNHCADCQFKEADYCYLFDVGLECLGDDVYERCQYCQQEFNPILL